MTASGEERRPLQSARLNLLRAFAPLAPKSNFAQLATKRAWRGQLGARDAEELRVRISLVE